MSSSRIALVLSGAGSGAIRAIRVFRALVERGWDAHLVLDGHEARALGDAPELAAVGQRVHLSPAHRPRGIARLRVPVAVMWTLVSRPRRTIRWLRLGGRPRPAMLAGRDSEAVLIALRPRLVHLDSESSVSARVSELVGSRTVVTVRGPDASAPAPESPGFLTLSEPPVLTAEFLGANGGDPSAAAERPFLRVLSVAPLSWTKGYEWAMQAIRLVLDAGAACEYRIVGSGPHLDAICFARHSLELTAWVELRIDPLDPGRLSEQLEWADVYLDPAVAAGSSAATAEALAAGVPAVVTDRSPLPRGAVDAESVFVVPRRDPATMARMIELLAHDFELRRRMGAAGMRMTRARQDDYVADVERAYRELGAGPVTMRSPA